MEENPLEKAVRLAGGQSSLARKATGLAPDDGRKPLTQKIIWKWLNRAKGPVPTDIWAVPIELAVEGQVTRYELREDVFGKAPREPELQAA